MPTSTKAAVYLRVSTQDQSTENQLPDLEALAARRNFTIGEVYSEKVSAAKERREYERLMKNGHQASSTSCSCGAWIVFTVQMVGALQTVLDLDRRGVQVVSYKEPGSILGVDGPKEAREYGEVHR